MTLVVDERATRAGQPGLHVLLVGVSDYPNLAQENPKALGMKPLSSTALTAYGIYQWLQTHREQLSLPLVTCRLLLSPGAAEVEAEPELAAHDVERATLDNFIDAAFDWREDAAAHAGNMTLFYFAGHGVQRSKSDALLLLEEFADPRRQTLHYAVDVNNLFYGMAPSSSHPEIARTQLYFVDACRNPPQQLKEFDSLQASIAFDVELSGRDDRCAPLFYAALPDSKAYALKGEQTVFSKALLDALAYAAEEPTEDDGGEARWPVTILSLTSTLAEHFERLGVRERGDQEFVLGGLVRDAVIYYLEEPPPVEVALEVDPADALPCTRISVLNALGQVEQELPIPLPSNPFQIRVPAGIYRFVGMIDPPTPPFISYDRLRQLDPPLNRVKVKVSS